MTIVVSAQTDSNRHNRTKPAVLPIALCAESKLPALTSKESIKCIKKNKKINQL